MNQVVVDLGDKSYPVHIGNGLLTDLGPVLPEEARGAKVAVITNPTVNELYGIRIKDGLLKAGCEVVVLEMPDSETAKSMREAERLHNLLVDSGLDRTSCVLALGGGVVGDVAGFVAATYMRGIGLINVPTTLLSQVDSAIGGKTGVDLETGKNLVGAFHQPRAVLSDIITLTTLPEEEFRSGLAEVVKYGVILDSEFYLWLEENSHRVLGWDPEALLHVVTRCSQLKAGVVAEDEREHGRRAILNFGHTLGHALEAASGYSMGHGEAVAVGMVFAARLSAARGNAGDRDLERLERLLHSYGLPTSLDGSVLNPDDILAYMGADKKARSGKLRFVVNKGIGEAEMVDDIPQGLIADTLKGMMP